MRRLAITFTLGALLASALPAGAQVYPERIHIVYRAEATVRVGRYQRNAQRETQTERTTKTVRLAGGGEVNLSNIAGDILVTRGGGNDVTVEIVKTGRGRTADDAKAALELVDVDIVERAGRVEVRPRYQRAQDARRRNTRDFNVTVSYNVSAPEGARITANSVSGDISVKDIKGDLTLETVSGDVRVANAARLTKASTASGDVEIVDTAVEGTLNASTISGTMTVRNVKARRLDVGSVSGDVVLENVECERIDAQSISGDVHLTGPLVRGGRYDLGSHSGGIRVTIRGSVGFELDASSFSGVLRTDLPLKGVDTQPASRGRQRSLEGSYGDGGAFLDLTTFSGSIVITKQ